MANLFHDVTFVAFLSLTDNWQVQTVKVEMGRVGRLETVGMYLYLYLRT